MGDWLTVGQRIVNLDHVAEVQFGEGRGLPRLVYSSGRVVEITREEVEAVLAATSPPQLPPPELEPQTLRPGVQHTIGGGRFA